MRVAGFIAGLVALAAAPALADNYSDLDQCKFVGEISKADQSIATCDRLIGDSTVTASSRAAALVNRCGWRWAKKDPDRALADCNEAIGIDARSRIKRRPSGSYESISSQNRLYGSQVRATLM